MTQAPERIWVTGNDHTGSWNDHEVSHVPQNEYIRADLARPRVKPLVWGKAERNGMTEQADCPFGRYYISDRGEHGWLWFMPGRLPHAGRVASCQEAKAEAQADCESRILKALEPTPDDRAALDAMLAEARRDAVETARQAVWDKLNGSQLAEQLCDAIDAALRAEAE